MIHLPWEHENTFHHGIIHIDSIHISLTLFAKMKRDKVLYILLLKNGKVLVNVDLHLHKTQNNGIKMTMLKYSDMWRCHLA